MDAKGNLRCWRREGNDLQSFRSTPRKIMRINDLYSARSSADIGKYERAFSRIELDASKALSKMLDSHSPILDSSDSDAWIKFLLAQRARTPARIAWAKEFSQFELRQALGQEDPEFDELNTEKNLATCLEYVEKNYPHMTKDFHLETIMEVIDSPKNTDPLRRMRWFIRKYQCVSIIISDNPLILWGNLHQTTCILALPISPDSVFFAVSKPEFQKKIMSENVLEAAAKINHDQAMQAQRLIVGDAQPQFLLERFCRNKHLT